MGKILEQILSRWKCLAGLWDLEYIFIFAFMFYIYICEYTVKTMGEILKEICRENKREDQKGLV